MSREYRTATREELADDAERMRRARLKAHELIDHTDIKKPSCRFPRRWVLENSREADDEKNNTASGE